ncbi:MAG: ATP-binding protein [Anaerolineae bacterium]|nr:ATP-binding protein [Anaerolineae bacterium]MDW8100305.1 ATP-binding protein [Anaerolineae bacterium]
MRNQLSKEDPQGQNPTSLDEIFGYLQRDALNLIAWGILAISWLGVMIFYNPVDRRMLTTWLPAIGIIWLACLAALSLNQYHFRLAATVLSTLLLIADGIALHTLQNGQLLYFAVPVISLANYLVGPLIAGAALAGIIFIAGLGISSGISLSELVGPLVLAFLTVIFAWLSSRYLYVTLRWAWASHLRSLEKAKEAQQHRAELARAHKSLEEAYHRLNRLNEALIEAWKAAEEAKRFKAQLAANISHELRTPLYIIVGFSETMLFAPESYGQELPAAYRSDLMEIYNSSRHLLSLIDDVLDLSQIEAGRIGLVKEPTNVVEIIQEAVDLIQALVERKGLSLQVRIRQPLPILRLDRTRIRQVLLNLLNNAARYTDQGEIIVEAWIDRRQLLICVADTGPGIPTEHLERIFESFYQVDASTGRRYGGVGLGLAISKYLVELHGGRIWAESQPGIGSRFYFALPLPEELQERDYAQGRLRRGTPLLLARADVNQVLLVHSDPTMVRLLERHLDGYQVIYAANPTEAEELLKTMRPRAIVVADSEVAAALVLKKDVGPTIGLSGIPVITCPLPSEPRSVLAARVRGYLVKPVTRERLLSTLEQNVPQARRILVIDDDPRVVRLLTRMLLSVPRRYQVLRAFDGREALALMRTQRPDLVLLDLYMPEPDGFTVLDHMVHDPTLAQIPVVVVSAKGLPEDGVLQLRGAITISRPSSFTLAELFRYLQALLDASGPSDWNGRANNREPARALSG